MRIQVVSDLHLDHSTINLVNHDNSEVLVVAGDVVNLGYKRNQSTLESWFLNVKELFPHVIWVLGNHEFYGGYWNKTVESWRSWAKTNGIHLLEDEYLVVGDTTFLGCTLWTNLNNRCPITDSVLRSSLNDFRAITFDGEFYRKLKPFDTLIRHEQSVNWLKSNDYHTKKVVITHHSPSTLSIHPQYLQDRYLNGGYCSGLEYSVVEKVDPLLWIHGHTHHSWDYQLFNTRVLCNPRGYGNENPHFDPHLTIEV